MAAGEAFRRTSQGALCKASLCSLLSVNTNRLIIGEEGQSQLLGPAYGFKEHVQRVSQ